MPCSPESDRAPLPQGSLRDQAELLLALDDGAVGNDLPASLKGDLVLMLHELRVHQIELEMQNDELRRAQIEIESSRARYFELFDLAPVGYLNLSELGLILEANFMASEQMGLLRSQLVGKRFAALVAPTDQDTHYLFRKAVLDSGTLQSCTVQMVKHDKTPFWADLEAIEARREGMSPVIRVTLKDATERVESEQAMQRLNSELARSNTDLEQFAYAASHDLVEPLRSVSGSLMLLQKRCASQLDATAGTYIHHAVEGSVRMQAMIKDLLTYSRVRVDRKDDQPVPLRLAFDRACGNLGEVIVESEANISCGELPVLRGDLGQLTLLFQNLIGNALKFHGDKPPVVSVKAQRQTTDWLFSVTDQGIGIEEKHLERVFNLFKRLHTQEEYAGTGIGLTLCKKIVERHGGTIWIESSFGVGSTFFFTLPDLHPAG